MNAWVLILYIGASTWSENESNALAVVPGFASDAVCQAAGKKAAKAFDSMDSDVKFVCVATDMRIEK